MKKTFWQINQQVLLSEDAPMGGGMDMEAMGGGPPGGASPMGGGPPSGASPMGGGPPGGGMGGPPIGGPPMGGGMGGPPMGGGMGLDAGMGGAPGDNSNKQIELKPLDVWDVLNKVLDGKKIKVEKQKKPIQPPPNNVQSEVNPPQGMPNEAQPDMNPQQGMPN